MNTNLKLNLTNTALRKLRGGAMAGLVLLLGACANSTKPPVSDAEAPPALTKENIEIALGNRISNVTFWPSKSNNKGDIIFSHGALSAPHKYENLISYWVDAGYNVYAPLHVDSTDHPQTDQYKGLASWSTRLEDVIALRQTLGDKPYIAAGHSYGALVALTLGGAKQSLPAEFLDSAADPNVSMVLAFSPPGPMAGFVSKEGYASLAVPALIQTGHLDVPPGGGDWQPHLAAYKAAADGGNRYALVFSDVDHYFGGAICRPELPGPAQNLQLAKAAELSIQMIDAFHHNKSLALQELNAQVTESNTAKLKFSLSKK